jgi:ectoine hydroxylase-related dioxygenase (phytanoyl-CoA dioxygenase family)
MDITQDIKNLNYYGYTILKNVLSKEECSYYIELIKKYSDNNYKEKLKKNLISGWDGGWLHNLQNKDLNFLKVFDNEYIEKILKYKLNDKFNRNQENDDPNYILQLFSARSSGKEYLDIHSDMRANSSYDSTLGLTVLWYLTDTNKNNGCTYIVPGSHNINLREGSASYITDREFSNLLPIEANMGDVIIFDQGLWHGSYGNNTDEKPWRLMAGFHRWWIKQSFDIPASLPNKYYQKLSNKEKSILGFCSQPPKDEYGRISMTCKYKYLKESI